jgi:Cu(I)/Ag(I) efflux system protein CusF
MPHALKLTLLGLLTAAGHALAQSPDLSSAEVRRIDLAAGKITLQHGEIKNLGMPPMTMVFQAKDPAVLAPIKVGDKVQFSADKVNGAYTVRTLALVK